MKVLLHKDGVWEEIHDGKWLRIQVGENVYDLQDDLDSELSSPGELQIMGVQRGTQQKRGTAPELIDFHRGYLIVSPRTANNITIQQKE